MNKDIKKIVIYLDSPGKYDYPLDKRRYIESYSDLCFELSKMGVSTYIARGKESYIGNGQFSISYVFNDNRELELFGKVQADLVFDKGDKDTFPNDDKVPKINKKEIDRVCFDKFLTAKMFVDISPMTLLVPNRAMLSKALLKLPGSTKVFKPISGFGGADIIIGSSEEILDSVPGDNVFPAMAQEFINTAKGIPGLVESYHDLRIILIDGEVLQASLRTPAPGSKLSNIKLGGSIKILPLSQIPDVALNISKQVDKRLSKYGSRIYSVDMVFDGEKYYLMELNSRPGWHPISVGHEAKYFVNKLASMLVNAVEL